MLTKGFEVRHFVSCKRDLHEGLSEEKSLENRLDLLLWNIVFLLFYVGLSYVPVKLCCRFGHVSYIHLIRGVAPVSAIFSKLSAVSWLVFVLVILVSWFVFG